MEKKETYLQQLNAFDADIRRKALKNLLQIENFNGIKEVEHVNMHIHSFCSYNAESWSPSRIAYEYKKAGLLAAGLIDFDVIDGMDEFIHACQLLSLRYSVGIETRAYLHEFFNKEIDSPGEPGVSYIAAAGFVMAPSNKEDIATLEWYKEKSKERNISLINRINQKLSDIAIDYNNDVLPLTPYGNATERHIISAYINKASDLFSADALVQFWSQVLNKNTNWVTEMLANRPEFENQVRSKLAKNGGIGYVQPDEHTFPPVEDFFAFARRCGAIPMESWLDGTSEGEKDPYALLEISIAKGAEALNIIPDRNWNIKNAEDKKVKLQNLHNIVKAAKEFDLPLHIGTEMNKKGQVFYDDLNTPDLKPFKMDFINGAMIVAGHCILSRYADYSYVSAKALSNFKTKKEKNQFFANVGKMPAINQVLAEELQAMGTSKAFLRIMDSVKQGEWLVKEKI